MARPARIEYEKIGIGLLGLNFGRYMLEKLILQGEGAPHFELAALCDLEPERARAAGERYDCAAYGSYQDMLANPQVEAVPLFSGPNERAELIRQAIRAGKDVITTKPFGTY